MNEAYETLESIQLLAFALLGVLAVRHWRRRPSPASGWLAATLGSFALVAAIGAFFPEEIDTPAELRAAKGVLLVLNLFPYFLYRFMSTFVKPPRWLDKVAIALTALACLATVMLPYLPQPDEPAPGWVLGFIAIFLANWSVLSAVVGVRLWRGGKGQPGVARRRMRTLSLATLGLALALLISGVSSPTDDDPTPLSFALQIATFATAPLFLLGFAPPRLVRMAWRRDEELALRAAELELMKALDPQQIADVLLPSMCALVGGEAAVLHDLKGEVVGSYLASAGRVNSSVDERHDKGSTLTVPLRSGDIVVHASQFTPFFGSEEAQILQSLGVLADLALARAEHFQAEQRKNSYLRILQQVTASANAPGGPHQAIQAALDTVCTETWWTAGHAYMVNADPNRSEPTHIWHLEASSALSEEFRSASEKPALKSGRGMIGRVFSTGESLWVANLAQDPEFTPRGGVAQEIAAAMVPIKVGSDVAGVLEFFADETREPDDEFLNVLTQIGVQLGRAVERAQSQDQLARRAEDLARSNADLEQFAYVASHDLQEPLRMVSSYMQLLSERYESELDETGQRYIHYAVDGAGRMQNLVRDLLSFSRVGSRGLEKVPTDLNMVVGQTLNNSEVAIKDCGAVVSSDKLPTVNGDPAQLTQLFQNLISNAVKFHGETQPEVRISAERQPDEWLFSVTDNGVGFDAKYAERVFVIFKRLHSREDYPGTGIGLAICKKIIERHGGRIWAESEIGQGTSIFFTLPQSEEVAS